MSIAEGVILKIAQHILLPDTQTAINVFWAELLDNVGSGPLADDDVLDAASNWMDSLYANLAASMADTVSGTLVEVWIVNESTGVLTPVGDEVTTWDGTTADDALPNGIAAICSLKTTDTRVTGRKFIPGMTDAGATDNNLVGDALSRLALWAADWPVNFVDANDVEFNPGVYSGVLQSFFPASGVVIANAIVGYQRRRKPGVGS